MFDIDAGRNRQNDSSKVRLLVTPGLIRVLRGIRHRHNRFNGLYRSGYTLMYLKTASEQACLIPNSHKGTVATHP